MPDPTSGPVFDPVIDVAPEALHPECPDVSRLGPTPAEAVLRARAARVEADHVAASGPALSRRRFLAGAGAAGAAGLTTHMARTRVSFGADTGSGTLVVIFLRGGMDGLSAVVPADDPHLLQARPDIAVRAGALLPLDRGFGLHPALAPLHALWNRGQFTAVPAVSTPEISRSHFQAQDCLERGGSATGTIEGWLDRVLDRLGPGTTFRSVSQGSTIPRAMAGDQPSLSLRTIEDFALRGGDAVHQKTLDALSALYTGLDHPLAPAAATTLEALGTADMMNAASYQVASTYPEGDLATGLREVARLVKSDVGLRVAAIDVGGWDMHAGIGSIDDGRMRDELTSLGWALGAFATDLGDRFDDVTVVAMTEFGRRIAQNGSNGTDHGHGAAVLLMGGRLAGGTVHGNWQGLAPEVTDQGDVPGSNDYRNVLGEVASGRLGLSAADLAAVFPGHRYRPLGVVA